MKVHTSSNLVLTTKNKLMKKLEKITLGALILLSALTVITWTIGILWDAPNDGIVCNVFKFLLLGVAIAFGSFACVLFYNEEIKQQ
jgi:hypothetical protein